MTIRQRVLAVTKFILTILLNVSTQQEVTHITDPSGEFESPEYPNTPAVFVAWNITVEEDHQILLQFLDFQLTETGPPCHIDRFELYDGEFDTNFEVGRWCWDTFDELNPKIYISSGNVFFLRLRTFVGYSRKGFKANYSTIPKEAGTITTVSVIQSTATTPTTPSQTVPKEAATTTTGSVKQSTTTTPPTKSSKIVLTEAATTATENVIQSTSTTLTKSSQIDVANRSGTTLTTIEIAETSNNLGVIFGVTAVVIIFIFVVIILIAWKRKINNRAKESSTRENFGSSLRAKTNLELYEEISKEKIADIEGNYENTEQTTKSGKAIPATDSSLNVPQSAVYSKEIFGNGDRDTPDGTYEKPDVNVYSYADPNELRI